MFTFQYDSNIYGHFSQFLIMCMWGATCSPPTSTPTQPDYNPTSRNPTSLTHVIYPRYPAPISAQYQSSIQPTWPHTISRTVRTACCEEPVMLRRNVDATSSISRNRPQQRVTLHPDSPLGPPAQETGVCNDASCSSGKNPVYIIIAEWRIWPQFPIP